MHRPRAGAPSPLDPYVVESLLPDLVGHDKRPSALVTYLVLWHWSGATGRVTMSLSDIAWRTGLSKRAAQDAVRHLARRRLVAIHRASITAVPEYEVLRPWRRKGQ